nr:integrase arm-type DNA-binding domain-containing protein [Schlegelella koreensis]
MKPATIDNAKPRDKAYPLTDGGGLYVDVLPTGSKVWRFKYHHDGKREKVTIGPYPQIGIKAARDRHEELRTGLAEGKSPAKAKRAEKVEKKVAAARAVTFREFSNRWVEETLFYRSAGYRAQTVRWLDQYVNPAIGDRALSSIEPADVLPIIESLRATAVTAERVRTIIQQVFNHAIKALIVGTNPATPLRGLIKRPPVQNHRYLTERELASFWRLLGKQGAHATTIAATRLLVLTMVRKNELLRAQWPEFDLEAAVWNIPAARMKNRKPHRVFLSRQAVEILRELQPLTGHAVYVFPSIYRDTVPMGDVTLNHFFKRMDIGVPDFSPHGTRGTAATLLREHGFGRDVVELLLAHAEADATVAAYSHHEHAAERRRALQFLADRVDKLAAGADVVPLKAA